ncbi:MAG: glutamine--tRNA ligase, partial [Gammaproteobacteria bacterium]
LNDNSLTILTNSKIEPHATTINLEDRVQFERQGYFCLDSKINSEDKFVFNRIATLRDSWAKT